LPELQARFGLDFKSTSLLISVVSFSKIFMPFIAGALATKLGIRNTITFGLLCICAALWTPFASSYPEVLTSRFIFGLGGAVVVTLIGSVAMQWFPKNELPIVNGFNYVAVNTGISLSLFITLPLAQRLGQRNTLLAYAALSCVIALLWIGGGRVRTDRAAQATDNHSDSYRSVMRERTSWYLALSFAGPLALYLVFNTWLPTFYAQAFGMTKTQSSAITGLFNLAGIPAAIVGGVLTKVYARRRALIIFPGTLMGASAFGLFLAPTHTVLFISAVFFGIALFLWISPLTTLAMELPGMTPKRLGMVMGIFYSVSYIAAFFAPILVGAIRDRAGSFLPGFAIFAIASWSLSVFGYLLPESGGEVRASSSR
jgi:cyanate permease